ncbi:MAG: hypothetical protein WEB30_02605 [Cyclobacteriaceae bacterium]
MSQVTAFVSCEAMSKFLVGYSVKMRTHHYTMSTLLKRTLPGQALKVEDLHAMRHTVKEMEDSLMRLREYLEKG